MITKIKKINNQNLLRYSILIFFLILFTIFSLRHFILGGGVAPSIDALCPFGGFETLITFISTGNLVPRIMLSSLILGFGIVLITLLFKKGFCGYICPFGTVQEILGKITRNKIKIPEQIDNKLRYLKYVFLALIIIGTAYTGTLVFRSIDPFMTFFHFGKGILWDFDINEFGTHIFAFGFTIAILISAIFIDRFWCKYLCPLGAVMSIFSKFGLTKLHRNIDKKSKNVCIDCKICEKICPMNVKVTQIIPKKNNTNTKPKTKSRTHIIKSTECINCNLCVTKCPKNSLKLKIANNHTTPTHYAMLLIICFFSIIFFAKIIGAWDSVPTANIVSEEGEINTDYIKGWMTLEEVAESSKISIHHFIQDFNFPSNIDPKTPLKDISKTYNIPFETDEIRKYIKNFKHNPSHHNTQEIEQAQELEETTKVQCPYGIEQDPSPGQCGLYIDKDNNNYCDYSE